MKHDGEQIVKYLRTECNVKKIGAHGQSMGGFVVSHLAKHANLEYACADRTFSSLSNVAGKMFGPFVEKLFLWTTGWSDDSGKSFSDANCFKVLCFDPKDEVIPYLASLRSGVTNSVAERLLELDSGAEPQNSPKKRTSVFTLRGLSMMKIQLRSWFQPESKQLRSRSSQEYQEILTSAQLSALYSALSRIVEIYKEDAKIDSFSRRQYQSSSLFKQQIELISRPAEPPTNLEASSDDLSAEVLETEDFDEKSPIKSANHTLKPKKTIQAIARDNSSTENSLIATKSTDLDQKSTTTTQQQITSYIPLLHDKDRYSEEFHRFISSVITFNLYL